MNKGSLLELLLIISSTCLEMNEIQKLSTKCLVGQLCSQREILEKPESKCPSGLGLFSFWGRPHSLAQAGWIQGSPPALATYMLGVQAQVATFRQACLELQSFSVCPGFLFAWCCPCEMGLLQFRTTYLAEDDLELLICPLCLQCWDYMGLCVCDHMQLTTNRSCVADFRFFLITFIYLAHVWHTCLCMPCM